MHKAILVILLALNASAAHGAPQFKVEPKVVRPGTTVRIVLTLPFLGGARTAALHYGFNGWNVPLAGPGAGREETVGNINYFRQLQLTQLPGTREWEVAVDVPATARALHFAVCRDECGSGQWDNNGGQDFSWPIAFPYIGPMLSWNGETPPSSGIVVTFLTSTAAPAWIRVAPVDRPREVFEQRDEDGQRHSFVLRGLAPGTLYSYQVGSETFVSERYRFRTASASPRTARFAIFADAQDNGETGTFSATVDEIVRSHADLDFVLVAGDMPWNDNPGDWWSFFDKARPLFATKVVMPAIGNHDTPGVGSSWDHGSFERLFTLPKAREGGVYYGFDFGPARFFALDSERMVDFSSPSGEQLRWLRERLAERRAEIAASPTPLWTFSYWHIPPYNAGARHWQQQFDFRPVTREFGGVMDWNFAGHEHLAQRMRPLSFGEGDAVRVESSYGVGPNTGAGFLLVPPAGAVPERRLVESSDENGHVRDLLAFPQMQLGVTEVQAFNGFSRVDVDGASIRIRTYGAARAGESSSGAFSVRDEIRYSK